MVFRTDGSILPTRMLVRMRPEYRCGSERRGSLPPVHGEGVLFDLLDELLDPTAVFYVGQILPTR